MVLRPANQFFLLHKTFPGTSKKYLTVPSFKVLAVLFSDLQNSGYVKPHNVALPLTLFGIWWDMGLYLISAFYC